MWSKPRPNSVRTVYRLTSSRWLAPLVAPPVVAVAALSEPLLITRASQHRQPRILRVLRILHPPQAHNKNAAPVAADFLPVRTCLAESRRSHCRYCRSKIAEP